MRRPEATEAGAGQVQRRVAGRRRRQDVSRLQGLPAQAGLRLHEQDPRRHVRVRRPGGRTVARGAPRAGASDGVAAVEAQARAGPALDSMQLLLDLAGALHGAYLPTDEVERRVREAARGLHADGEVFTLQTLAAVDLQGSP